MFYLILTAFMFGLAGSIHCMAMCGPLVMTMPFANAGNKTLAILIYMTGKCFAYGILGLVLGLAGQGLILANWQQTLSIAGGFFILLITLWPMLVKKISPSFLFNKQFSFLYKKIFDRPSGKHFFAIGFFNGLLPCGLVYTALAAAAVTGNMFTGFLWMFVFGIGTIPALGMTILFKTQLNRDYKRIFSKLPFALAIAAGVLLMLRGMNLNIPFVSPFFRLVMDPVSCH